MKTFFHDSFVTLKKFVIYLCFVGIIVSCTLGYGIWHTDVVPHLSEYLCIQGIDYSNIKTFQFIPKYYFGYDIFITLHDDATHQYVYSHTYQRYADIPHYRLSCYVLDDSYQSPDNYDNVLYPPLSEPMVWYIE